MFKSNEKSTVKVLPSTALLSLVIGFIMENVIAYVYVNVKFFNKRWTELKL